MDAEINLVPFIDLLSCCIAFLMIVATWAQIARIDVAPAPTGPSESEAKDDDPLKLGITLTAQGYTLTDISGAALQIPKKASAYDDAELETRLKQIREKVSKETTSKVAVTSEDGVAYKHLITVMDVCLRNDFTGISVGSVN